MNKRQHRLHREVQNEARYEAPVERKRFATAEPLNIQVCGRLIHGRNCSIEPRREVYEGYGTVHMHVRRTGAVFACGAPTRGIHD